MFNSASSLPFFLFVRAFSFFFFRSFSTSLWQRFLSLSFSSSSLVWGRTIYKLLSKDELIILLSFLTASTDFSGCQLILAQNLHDLFLIKKIFLPLLGHTEITFYLNCNWHLSAARFSEAALICASFASIGSSFNHNSPFHHTDLFLHIISPLFICSSILFF